MFNPHSDAHLGRLRRVLKASKDEMQPAQANRLKAHREMLGKHSPYSGSATARPLNLLDLARTIYTQNLVPSNPRASFTARKRDLAAYAYSYELAVNTVLGEDNVPDEVETCVLEAMFAPLGVIKISLAAHDIVELDGVSVSTGTPKIKGITFDNWVQDMSAGSPNSVAFCGDRYYVHRDDALNDGIYDPELVGKIAASEEHKPGESESQSLREIKFYEDYRDMLELWDIWLPDEGLLLTFAGEAQASFANLPPLRVVEWSGPEAGPYERLYFSKISGNSLPNPPVAAWIDLHETSNRLINKLNRQAERQKTNDVVNSTSRDDGAKLKAAKDGDMLVLDQLNAKQTLRSGGIDNLNFAYLLQNKELFNLMSGNIFTMGGLQASTSTVGQDELLSAGASQRLRQMQTRVRDLLRRVAGQIATYLWESPLVDIPIQKEIAGRTVESVWNRGVMPGEFPDYLIDIDPYSLGDRTPAERLMQLQSAWREDILPALPIMQAQGVLPNFEGYIKQLAKLADLPEISDLVTYMEGETMPGSEPGNKPQTTTRRYERVSKASATPQGQDRDLMSRLLGSSLQPKEQAAAMG